jgi:type III restriction enzyme
VTGEDSEVPGKSVQKITNAFCFKTPLNIVFADFDPERRFIRKLCDAENAEKIDAWIKSTDRDFYPIEFSWKKGEHTKRGTFNPDYFIKIVKRIYVVEIKDDGQIGDPSEENKKKFEFAREHFKRLNDEQDELVYQFNFLSPQDYDAFFQKLRDGKLDGYQSHLDVALLA